MERTHYEHRHLDVACELTAGGTRTRIADWARLRHDAALGQEPIPGGARLWLRPEARQAADDLARQESECCGFLDFDLVTEAGRLHLDITSPADEAGPIIASLAGN